MNDAQSAVGKLQLAFVPKWAVLMIVERVGILAYAFVHPAHPINFIGRHAGANQQVAMLRVLQTPGAMACLPFVNKHFRILSFVSERTSKPAVVFVGMGQHNAANVRDNEASSSQTRAQGL